MGVGTVISALLVGFCLQLVFRLFKFDATLVKHQNLGEVFYDLFPGLARRRVKAIIAEEKNEG